MAMGITSDRFTEDPSSAAFLSDLPSSTPRTPTVDEGFRVVLVVVRQMVVVVEVVR